MGKIILFTAILIALASSGRCDKAIVMCKGQNAKYVYVITIPKYLNHGRMSVEGKNLRDTSTVSFLFSFYPDSPHYLIDAAFFLDIAKSPAALKSQKSFKGITVYQLMDSLKLNGREFLRNNTFYSVLPGDRKDEVRQTWGEYIYKKFSHDD